MIAKPRLFLPSLDWEKGWFPRELDADVFHLKGEAFTSKIASKTHALVIREKEDGTTKIEIPPEQQGQPSLSPQHLRELDTLLNRLKEHYGKAQDIEFAVWENQIYLLQTRPVTGLDKLPDPQGTYIVWDNSNIVESYPGVTTPLTFSFILPVYEAVYTQFLQLLGTGKRDLVKHQTTLANMLGLIRGRVYYNLLSWYKLLALIPGYSMNAEFMEKMMGVKERFDLPEEEQPSRTAAYYRILVMISRILSNLFTLPRQRRRFQRDLNAVLTEYYQIDFDQCRPDELMEHYERFEEVLLKKWKAPLVNDFFAMIFFGVLQKMLVKAGFEESDGLHNDLLIGSQDILSAEPVRRLLELSTLIGSDAKAMQLFKEEKPSVILKMVEQNELPGIASRIRDYLDRFGDRSVGELKLETTTFREDPTGFIRLIQGYVRQGVVFNSEPQRVNRQSRIDAEQKLWRALKGKFFRRKLTGFVLKTTRSLVSNRENLRYERTRAFGMVRSMFRAMGRNWFAEGILQHPEDIFYLKKDEIFSYIRGTYSDQKPRGLVALRKQEFREFENTPAPPERIKTYGMVYHGNDFYRQEEEVLSKGELQGLGCCPGQVRGKVRIVHDPNEIESLQGDILVTSSTDPGWVMLFPTASAILVERGSLLSHSAIVSRELGIPCVVGVTGLLKRLRSGDEVIMDGSSGVIHIIPPTNG